MAQCAAPSEDSEALSVVAIELARRLAEYEHVGGSSPLADVVQTSAFREFVGETTDIDLPRPWARWTIVLRHHEEQAKVVGLAGGGWQVEGDGFDDHPTPLNIENFGSGLDASARTKWWRFEKRQRQRLVGYVASKLEDAEHVVATLWSSPAVVVTSERVLLVRLGRVLTRPETIAVEGRDRVVVAEWFPFRERVTGKYRVRLPVPEGSTGVDEGRVLSLVFPSGRWSWRVSLERCGGAFDVFRALNADHHSRYWNGERWARYVFFH